MKIFILRIHFLVIPIFILSYFPLGQNSQGATLRWDENTEGDLAGYKVHYGTSSGNYGSTIDVGKVTEYKLSVLNEGINYLAVTAYDSSYNESELSIEQDYFVDDGIPDDEDNCPYTPNGPDLGTCAETVGGIVKGTGISCTSDDDCGGREICEMDQEDFDDNGVGDVCECYADVNRDGYVGPPELSIFLNEYGRDDCFSNTPCQIDINNDGLVNPIDLSIFLDEYGREDCPVLP